MQAGDEPFGGHVNTPEGYLLALWIHECRRVFSDKLVTYDDKNWVDKTVFDLCKEHFGTDLVKQVCGDLLPMQVGSVMCVGRCVAAALLWYHCSLVV